LSSPPSQTNFLLHIYNSFEGCSVEGMAKLMKTVLTTISLNDPSGLETMKDVSNHHWQFKINHQRVFITSYVVSSLLSLLSTGHLLPPSEGDEPRLF
jgi:uncharacterized membrane protein